MKREANLVLTIWDEVRDHIAPAKRADVALTLLRCFEEFGFDERDLADISDEDAILARAYALAFDIEEDGDTSGEDEGEL